MTTLNQRGESAEPRNDSRSANLANIPVATLHVVDHAIGAVQAVANAENGFECRLFCQLQEGQELWVIGPGFDEKTVLCRCGDQLYYVFLSDLGIERKWKTARA